MKTPVQIKAMLFLASSFILFIFGLDESRGDQSSLAFRANFNRDPILWGAETNGIVGGIYIDDSGHLLPRITIYVRKLDNALPVFQTGNVTNIYQLAPLYLAATNLFCGPIELQDMTGNKVSLMKQSPSPLEPYPEKLSWIYLYENEMQKFKIDYAVPGDHVGFLLRTNACELTSFQPDDYFKPETAGEYKLTVWPKIYRQSETNKDLYQRIDVPPVSVTIKWGDGASK